MESTGSGYNPKIHHRRSIRLKGYDYSKAGLYFITICCQNRICRFGKIVISHSDNNSTNEQKGRPQGYAPTGDQSTIAKSEIKTMILNDAGKMVDEQWLAMVDRFQNIELHEYSIMPNHFHCILEIVGELESGRPQGYAPTTAPTSAPTSAPMTAPTYAPMDTPTKAPTDTSTKDLQNENGKPKNKTIGDMMDAFKSIITVEYIRGVKNKGWDRFKGKLLQRDYYEHIIRNELEYQRISEYIINNPSKWKEDKFYYQ